MYFSGKISNSILTFLERRGENLEGLFDLTDLPTEFLRDPSGWLEAHKLERLLNKLDEKFGHKYTESFIVQAGHSCDGLRAWGVLDSVLKIMQKPHDIYLQPSRFLSYFISPEPPVIFKTKESGKVVIELPLFASEYPLVSEYLRSALEAIPKYLGGAPAQVKWKKNLIEILWSTNQVSLLSEDDLNQQMRPELVQSLVNNLELSQKDLERKNEELSFKDQEIKRLKADINNLLRTPVANRKLEPAEGKPLPTELEGNISELKNQFLILNDYLARANQIITLLVGSSRNEAQVRMAMKRTGWDQVVASKSQHTRMCLHQIEELQQKLIPFLYDSESATQMSQMDKVESNQLTLT